MNALAQCDPSRWEDFLAIDDEAPKQIQIKQDLFVGKNRDINLILVNGMRVHFKDIVVLGKLTLRSQNPENTSSKVHIFARDVFSPGLIIKDENVILESKKYYEPENVEAFRKEIQQLISDRQESLRSFSDWLDYQREIVKKIGLKSILT